jgi:hypothetical protein
MAFEKEVPKDLAGWGQSLPVGLKHAPSRSSKNRCPVSIIKKLLPLLCLNRWPFLPFCRNKNNKLIHQSKIYGKNVLTVF